MHFVHHLQKRNSTRYVLQDSAVFLAYEGDHIAEPLAKKEYNVPLLARTNI